MQHFKYYTKQDILSLTKIRRFETKLGERLQVINDPPKLEDFLKATQAKFILFGVPEDIGTRANMGVGNHPLRHSETDCRYVFLPMGGNRNGHPG